MVNNAHTQVRIIAVGGIDDTFNGCVLPAASVLPSLWDGFGAKELEDEIAAGCGFEEWDVGTQCRIVSVAAQNKNPDYVLDALFEYNGRRWLPVREDE